VAEDPRRRLPSVDRLLRRLEEARPELPAWARREAARRAIGAAREALERGRPPTDPEAAALAIAADLARPRPIRVVNASGVVLHTNLGRAALPRDVADAVAAAAASYSALELDLESGERSERGADVAGLLCLLSGAADALAVNNGAAAVLLALAALARGREVIVSRGELVEIGGSFRIPEILREAGVALVEVGTTNRTHARDYEAALGPRTGAILKVHRSNFELRGFVAEVELPELVALGRRASVPVIEDLGSASLVDLRPHGLPPEAFAPARLATGVDLVCFSGDKLLGGPQAGIVLGAAERVQALRRSPLARALRLDKLSLAALEATLRLYRDPEAAASAIPVLRMLGDPVASVRARARRVIRGLGADRAVIARAEVVTSTAEVGGGALPLARVPSFAVALRPSRGKVGDLARALRLGADPVLGRIESDRLLLDMRTVDPGEVTRLIASLVHALDEERGTG
jgi:L-seryl-tRNA(Ser) seleniumtransferase